VSGLGAAVTLVARRRAPLDDAKRALEASQPEARVSIVELDVADEAAVARTMAAELRTHGADMLVNNAGVVMPGRFVDLPPAQFRQMMERQLLRHRPHDEGARAAPDRARRRPRPERLVPRGDPRHLRLHRVCRQQVRGGRVLAGATRRALAAPDRCERLPAARHRHAAARIRESLQPAETKAIAGNVKTLPPAVVAQAMVDGMARGAFEIYPDLGSRLVARAQALVPGVTRRVCDAAQRKAARAT